MKDKIVLVIAPHPDDETLGCGGTLLLLKDKGCSINWLIITDVFEEHGYSSDRVKSRKKEIEIVTNRYKFEKVIKLGIPTSKVDELYKGELVGKISEAINDIKPNIIFIPFINDIHTDHKAIAEATISCTKWFRYSFIQTVLYYETISETDFNIDSSTSRFVPNVYVDIFEYLEDKISIMNEYKSEMLEFPFPRSEKAVKSLAFLRGSQCGAEAAEAFELLRTNIKLN